MIFKQCSMQLGYDSHRVTAYISFHYLNKNTLKKINVQQVIMVVIIKIGFY